MYRATTCLIVLIALAGIASAGKGKAAKLPCAGLVSCAKACDPKHVDACDRLDDLLAPDLDAWSYAPTGAGYKLARAKLPAVCKAKHVGACVMLGRLEALGVGGSVDGATAKTRFQEACDKGVDDGCVALGEAYAHNVITGGSAQTALATLEDACNRKKPASCAHYAVLLLNSTYSADERQKGVRALTDACDGGSAYGCYQLGTAYSYGYWVTATDALLGSRYSRKACKLGHRYACSDVGQHLPLDDDARAVLDAACDRGVSAACHTLASTQSDPVKRAAYDDRSCYAGDPYECTDTARLLQDPLTNRPKVAKDRGRWEKLLAAGCADGAQDACVSLATADLPPEWVQAADHKSHRNAKPAHKVVAKALKALAKYCDDDQAAACLQISWITSNEWYGDVDADAARRAAGRYCDLGGGNYYYGDEEDDWGGDVGGQCYEVQDVEARLADVETHQKCDGGDLQACATWGRAYWGDPDARLPALDKACGGKVGESCAWLAQAKWEAGEDVDLAPIGAACDGGDADLCLWILNQTAADPALAKRAAAKGCELGLSFGCVRSGDAATAASDLDGALAAYKRGCELDASSSACGQVPTLQAQKDARDQDAACARKDATACLGVGDRKASTAPKEAAAAYAVACDAKVAAGCRGAATLATDPLRRRELGQRACDLGDTGACGDVAAAWDQTGDKDKASAAWVKACEATVYGACTQAAAHLRPAKAKDKGSAAYRAVLERGCLGGDQALCDEAKYGYGVAPPITTSSEVSSSSSSSSYHYHAPSRTNGVGRLELGYGGTSRTGMSSVGQYYAGLDVRALHGRGSGWLALVRGQLAYDEQKAFGYDAAVGAGVHYVFSVFHPQVLAVAGRDKVGEGATTDPTKYGVPAAWYVGFEARSTLRLGNFGLTGTWDKLYRSGQPDEQRFDVTLDVVRRGKVYGLGIRNVEHDLATRATESDFLVYMQW